MYTMVLCDFGCYRVLVHEKAQDQRMPMSSPKPKASRPETLVKEPKPQKEHKQQKDGLHRNNSAAVEDAIVKFVDANGDAIARLLNYTTLQEAIQKAQDGNHYATSSKDRIYTKEMATSQHPDI